jgi:hypothetical protein
MVVEHRKSGSIEGNSAIDESDVSNQNEISQSR